MIRLTAGRFKGHSLVVPAFLNTRPTQSKLRQALFNSIQAEVPDAIVLDLFAGSGALGFEALSRGARKAVFVESAPKAIHSIQENIKKLKLSDAEVRVIESRVEKSAREIQRDAPYDLVFADPPYAEVRNQKWGSLLEWPALMNNGGLLFLEWSPQEFKEGFEDWIEIGKNAGFHKIREKQYGDTFLTTFQYSVRA